MPIDGERIKAALAEVHLMESNPQNGGRERCAKFVADVKQLSPAERDILLRALNVAG